MSKAVKEDVMILTLYPEVCPEVCCDLCGEIVHNHFDCPCCKDDKIYQGTTIYSSIWEEWVYSKGKEIKFSCEECNSIFKIINYNDDLEFEFIIVENKAEKN